MTLRATVIALALFAALPAAAACPADCDGDRSVTVSELVRAVGIAIGDNGLEVCPAADADGDGNVTVSELVRAVNRALSGCLPDGEDLTVANLNFLHGLFCPNETGNCRLADRTDLLMQWIAGSGCPDLVTLQEIWPMSAPLIRERLPGLCTFEYQVELATLPPVQALDSAMILSRYPIEGATVTFLHPGFRHVLSATIRHPLGAIRLFVTHLAARSDGATDPCGEMCPPECVAAGVVNIRQCQGVQVAGMAEQARAEGATVVAAGDFNEEPGSFVYRQFVERGFTDVYRAAGNPECDGGSGIGCTSGREVHELTDLESSESNTDERIDFIFLALAPELAACRLDGATDEDEDGSATRVFADLPNPFAERCGPLPDPICWPSDHEGVEMDLDCD